MIDTRQRPCPNCFCCEAARYCDGCGETLCLECWAEHNEDAPCHLRGPEEHEDMALRDGLGEGETRRVAFLIPFDAFSLRAE